MITAYLPASQRHEHEFVIDVGKFSGGVFGGRHCFVGDQEKTLKGTWRRQRLLAPETVIYQTKRCTFEEVGSNEDFQ